MEQSQQPSIFRAVKWGWLTGWKPGTRRLCEKCFIMMWLPKDFRAPLEPETRFNKSYTGTLSGLQESRSTCDLCGLFASGLERGDPSVFSRDISYDKWMLGWQEASYRIRKIETQGQKLEDVVGLVINSYFSPNNGVESFLGLFDSEGAGIITGHKVVPETIDIDVLKEWINVCKDSHSQTCVLANLDMHLRVIDTHNMCLTDLPEDATYTALSYVWGGSNNFVTTTLENEAKFMHAGGLAIRLPKTISDAIEVTRALGERYIWVDALCITQDDEKNRQGLIGRMDTIYSGATVTIVAASGDGANSGLSGWSDRHDRCRHFVDLPCDVRLGVLPNFSLELERCKYKTRAWTCQESALSNRCLVFLNGFVYFACKKTMYSEFTHLMPLEPCGDTDSITTMFGRRGSDPYRSVVNEYTSRTMTHQYDALNAISGLLKRLGPVLGSQKMYAGLPDSRFDLAILWIERAWPTLVRRPGFPSWSWVGWQGNAAPFPMITALCGRDDFQQWLLHGTWIDWYITQDDGTCQLVWDSANAPKTVGVNEQPVSYGQLAPGNAFGRSVDWSSLSPLRAPAAHEIKACKLRDRSALCFRAPIIRLPKGSLVEGTTTYDRHSLYDEHSVKFGHLQTDEKLQEDIIPTLAITSRAVPAGLCQLSFEDSDLDAIYKAHGMKKTGKSPENDFLTVLWIRETQDWTDLELDGGPKRVQVYERGGIGFVFRHALKQMEQVQWKEVVLV